MPASYPIPNWLNSRESPAEAYLQAIGIGQRAKAAEAQAQIEYARLNAQIQHQQQALAQQERLAMMETMSRQEIAQQKAAKEQQRNAVAQAYHQEQIALQRQKLDQAGKDAAKKYAAQQKFSALVASGVPIDQAYVQVPELIAAGGIDELLRFQAQRERPVPLNLRRMGEQIVATDPITGESHVSFGSDPRDWIADPSAGGYQNVMTEEFAAHPPPPPAPVTPKTIPPARVTMRFGDQGSMTGTAPEMSNIGTNKELPAAIQAYMQASGKAPAAVATVAPAFKYDTKQGTFLDASGKPIDTSVSGKEDQPAESNWLFDPGMGGYVNPDTGEFSEENPDANAS